MVGMWFGGESLLVDDDLMVVPAEGDQIVRVGGSALAPGDEMVDLESMRAGTSVGLAREPVAVEYESSQGWWDGSGLPSIDHWDAVFACGGDFDDRIAKDRL
jgi:hypothetical protein